MTTSRPLFSNERKTPSRVYCEDTMQTLSYAIRRLILLSLVVGATLCLTPQYGHTEEQPFQSPRAPFGCNDCNILFISLTNVRYDHLGFNGYHRPTSPHLDRLAQRAVVFENAFTVASWTIPVLNSLYTAQYPLTHQIMTRYGGDEDAQLNRLPRQAQTLVDVLGAQGYTTASINGSQDYLPRHGLTDRFDTNLSLTTSKGTRWGSYGSMADVAPSAVDWLKKNRARKFFLHLQAYDAHCPYGYPHPNLMFDPDYKGQVDFTRCYWTLDRTRPLVLNRNGVKQTYYSLFSEAKGKDSTANSDYIHRLGTRDIDHMLALYDGEIHNMDGQLQQVFDTLETLELMDKTIIVVFAEHGELFGKDGRFMRGGPLRGTFYDDVLHVPMLLYHPHADPARVRSLVSLIDLGPTVLELVGITPPAAFHGQSFVPVMTREDPTRTIFAGSVFANAAARNLFRHATVITAVRNQQMKLIRERLFYYDRDQTEVTYELYNVQVDPEERRNLAEAQFSHLEHLNRQLNTWLESTVDMRQLLEAVADPGQDE